MGKRLRTSMADKVKVKRTSTTTKRKRLGVGEKVKLEQKTRSGLESKALDILNRNEIKYEYEPVNGKIKYQRPATNHTYLPDIVIDGVVYELKGYWQDRDKMVHIINSNPHLEIIMVFMRDQPVRKGAKMTYSKYCEKHGIKWMLFDNFEQNILKRHGN